MHHIFIIIDSIRLITGSFNWTVRANKNNMENIVLINNSLLADKYTEEFNRLWKIITSKDISDYLSEEYKTNQFMKKLRG